MKNVIFPFFKFPVEKQIDILLDFMKELNQAGDNDEKRNTIRRKVIESLTLANSSIEVKDRGTSSIGISNPLTVDRTFSSETIFEAHNIVRDLIAQESDVERNKSLRDLDREITLYKLPSAQSEQIPPSTTSAA